MKKIFTVSIMAVMAVTAANAEIASKAYVDTQTGTLSNLNTTAKTNLVGAINELVTKTGTTSVADQIASALTEYTKTGLDTAYATAAQGAKADTAVQTVVEGTANGTIAVDGTDVAVHGLGSAAYTASTAYDASGTAAGLVGTLSNLTTTDKTNVVAAINEVKGAVSDVDTGVMSVAEGTTNGTIAVDGTDVAVHGLGSAAYTESTAYATAAQGLKADSAVQTVSSTGNGNVVTAVSANTNGTVTVTSGITAIPQPSGQCTDCVLHYNGTTYTWEEITR